MPCACAAVSGVAIAARMTATGKRWNFMQRSLSAEGRRRHDWRSRHCRGGNVAPRCHVDLSFDEAKWSQSRTIYPRNEVPDLRIRARTMIGVYSIVLMGLIKFVHQ